MSDRRRLRIQPAIAAKICLLLPWRHDKLPNVGDKFRLGSEIYPQVINLVDNLSGLWVCWLTFIVISGYTVVVKTDG